MKSLFDNDEVKKPMDGDTKYSRAIKIPQYTPSKEKPSIEEMYDLSKYSKLMAKINKSEVTDDEKKFLKYAASRHIVFTYSKIADYYAQASKEMQELMEESALVILDIDDAIANGYIALSEKMKQLIDEQKEKDAQAKESMNILQAQRDLMEQKEKEKKESLKASNKQKKNKGKQEEPAEGFMNEPKD